eukprot:TRINITY_DN1182_c0_g2_i1.p1 TRINITY_DN1182_c0_g2~~TRINITY_DN1182_c0_g2_i1.p1  ORF type:complete len:529 (-),score=159.02 TRINITY_DN1182_c0_g2_i1:168-1754(-)
MFFLRRFAVASGVVGAGWVYDHFTDERVTRNLRSIVCAAQTLIDYKFFYDPEKLDEQHLRVAKRILNVCLQNDGLYIKFGQGIAAMNHVLPPQWNRTFAVLQDGAPSVPFEEVERIVRDDFGVPLPQLFAEFDRQPVASASIAQVHKARLHDGTTVAVKVQKPAIRKQLDADLFVYRALVYLHEKAFNLPFYWTVDYIEENLRKEVDFENEARNSERAAAAFSGDAGVHVPRVHWPLTSKRVMTAEWIDGVKFNDHDGIRRLGLSVPSVVGSMVQLFAKQIFVAGFVHCDPHPGNMMVRRQPNGQHQIVLLDHGLYIQESETFRQQYCELWKAMVLTDVPRLQAICRAWGIKDPTTFASMQLMKPYTPSRAVHIETTTKQDIARMQAEAKEKVRTLLEDSSLIPRELIFVGRNMNLVRANNKEAGSPVNRVNIMCRWAARGLALGREDQQRKMGILRQLQVNFDGLSFRTRLFAISMFYYATQWWRAVNGWFGRRVGGFEETLEKGMSRSIEEQYGFRLEVDQQMVSN